MQIADHQELHPAKGLLGAAVPAQDAVYSIEQVCPNHTDFIDNQKIQAPDDIFFLLTEPVLAGMGLASGDERPEG